MNSMEKIYVDKRGWQYAVRPGLNPDIYKVFYRKPEKSWHAMRARKWFASEQEAEADLEQWAAEKGMKCVKG